MDTNLELTDRELKEIKHALYYADYCNHGTTGHNQLILIAKMAGFLGFRLNGDLQFVQEPVNDKIIYVS